jgi:transcriptional regulator GlxA family with amidase domain
MEIAIVVYDGFDDLDALGPYEVFSHAGEAGAELAVGLYTLDAQSTVESSHGLRLEPDGTVPASPDLVVVPGGGWSTRAAASAWGEAERGDLPGALARLHDEGTTVAAVCTGGMLLARAGLTDDRPAVTHHSALDDLEASGAEVVEARVVDDGDIITAGGITAGIDLAVHLVEREFGAEIAQQVTTTMEYGRRGEVVSA